MRQVFYLWPKIVKKSLLHVPRSINTDTGLSSPKVIPLLFWGLFVILAMDAEEVGFFSSQFHTIVVNVLGCLRTALPWLWLLPSGINIFPLGILLFSCNKKWESYCLFVFFRRSSWKVIIMFTSHTGKSKNHIFMHLKLSIRIG